MPMVPVNFTATGISDTEIAWAIAKDDDKTNIYVQDPAGDVMCSKDNLKYRLVDTIPIGVTARTKGGFQPATAYKFRARAVNGAGQESDWTGIDTGTTKPAPVVTPPPTTTPPPVAVTDPVFPPNATRVRSLDDINSKQATGKAFILENGEYKYGDSSGLDLHSSVSVYGEPGKVVIRSTTTAEDFPKGASVYGGGTKLYGLTFAGPAKTVGVQINSGVSGTVVDHCGAVDGDLGTFLELKAALNLVVTDCTIQRLRRYFSYGKVLNGVIQRCHFGTSIGGTDRNGATFAPEHGARFEWYDGVVRVTDCTGDQIKKSNLNAKRRHSATAKLIVERCKFYNVGLGPLADKDGLENAADPAYIATGIELRDTVITNELRLELNVVGITANHCDFHDVSIDTTPDYPIYMKYRQLPSGVFTATHVASWHGDHSKIKMVA